MKQIGVFFKKWWLLLAIIVVIGALVLFNMVGYRVGPGLSIVRVGTLVITDLPENASIYVDEAYNRRVTGGIARVSLLPGSHTVIVSVDGYYPWSELVEITSDAETTERPIIIPTKTNAVELEGEAVTAARTKINTTRLPSAFAPLSMEGGCAQISVSGNRILATPTTTPECVPPPYLCVDGSCEATVVFAPLEPIHTVLPYPGRSDALIVGVKQRLFVLEIDPRYPGFFAELVRGGKDTITPRAATSTDHSLVTIVGEKVYGISL
ncbi:PEGA domain-containing protein [Patescibacteria group bacterium]|nr:PEGA domain-containing protein [Patescibacteria group bacterium]